MIQVYNWHAQSIKHYLIVSIIQKSLAKSELVR
jgi:hypothetical protein